MVVCLYSLLLIIQSPTPCDGLVVVLDTVGRNFVGVPVLVLDSVVFIIVDEIKCVVYSECFVVLDSCVDDSSVLKVDVSEVLLVDIVDDVLVLVVVLKVDEIECVVDSRGFVVLDLSVEDWSVL